MRTIRVLVNFGGRVTQERRILPGVYQEDDERLFGQAQYLLKNGHAVVIAEPAPPPAPTEEPEAEEQPPPPAPTEEPEADKPPPPADEQPEADKPPPTDEPDDSPAPTDEQATPEAPESPADEKPKRGGGKKGA